MLYETKLKNTYLYKTQATWPPTKKVLLVTWMYILIKPRQ